MRSVFARYLAELQRRKVPRVAAAYAIVAFIFLQVAEITFEPLHFPDWALTVVVVVTFAGFPVALVLAWVFQITPEGLKHEDEPETSTKRAPAEPSIAVLSFEDMSPDQDQAYLCDGIAEEILNRLTQLDGLHVASRTSSFLFKGQATDIGTIASQLKVATVLEGSVRKAENQLRITTQLINAENGFHIWSNSYDRSLEDIFEIQDEIASHVAEALKVTFHGAANEDPGTENVRAYEYYLKGIHYFHRWGSRNVRFAIDMFEKAVETDPNYARAWAALGNCHAMAGMYWDASEEHLREAERASEKALELEPDLAQAHVSRGLSYVLRNRQTDAVEEFETAIRLNPELFSSYYFYGRVRFQEGDPEAAAQLFEKAEQVRPDDFQATILLRQVYKSLGRDDDARDAARRGIEKARRHLELNPDDTRALNLGLGALAELGEKEELVEWAERSLAIDGENPDTLYNVACGYSLIGETGRALDALEQACLCGTAIGEWAEHDSDLASLHDNPRFNTMLDELKKQK